MPSNVLPLRPRTVTDAVHAGRILELAPRYRAVLPRWGINSPIRCREPEPGTYSGQIGWWSREHYLRTVIPAAIAVHRDILKQHGVEPDTFRRWAAAKSLYAQEADSGRKVIVRPVTLANLLQITTRQVQRCNAAARQIGLEVVITPGRMLSEIEVYKARKAGSPQRGLSTVTAFVVPRSLVDHVTPTRGGHVNPPVADILTFKTRSARPKGAPLRSAPHQRPSRGPRTHTGPAWDLAINLTRQVIFLHRCPPARIVGQLQRFTDPKHTHGLRWTSNRLTRAMDHINIRLGYLAPVKAKAAPWGLLSWYLSQIDPYADHPAAGETESKRGH